MCWHKWSKWDSGTVYNVTEGGMKVREMLVQYRVCIKCGKKKANIIMIEPTL